MHANSSPNLIILLSPSRDYNMSLCSLYCVYCALKALVGKPTKTEIVWDYVQCSKQKVQKLPNCLLLWVFADFCGLFAYFCVFFAYILFVVWSIWGSTHCNVYNTTEKVACIFVIRGRSVGPGLNSGVDEQEQYILCAYVAKSCKTCWCL